MSDKPNWARANQLRNEASRSERRFWKVLRGDQMGVRFRRQYPVPPFTLDFYCPELKLNIELDGEQHNPEEDAKRDAQLKAKGIEVIRIPSLEIWDNVRLTEIGDYIWRRVQELKAELPTKADPS